jgi:hypothetical protein
MDIVKKIDESLNKSSFDDWLNDKKNYKKIEKKFNVYYNNYASEEGQSILDDEEDENFWDDDPIAAYEDNAHNMGYIAEYEAAHDTIKHLKREFDYKKNDENDEEKQYKLATKMGYKPSFR